MQPARGYQNKGGAVWTAPSSGEKAWVPGSKPNIGEVFQKFEANVYYNYADHIMDNYSLRSPDGGMSGGMQEGMTESSMGDSMDAGISMDMRT